MKTLQCLFLACVAATCLPLSTYLLFLNYLYISLFPRNPVRERLQKVPGFQSRTIFITGVNTPQGLRLARAFHDTGHKVIGGDCEPGGFPLHVRFSNALNRFYRPPSEAHREAAYIEILVQIIEEEHADLWINCRSSACPRIEAQARNIIEQSTKCQCFALRLDD